MSQFLLSLIFTCILYGETLSAQTPKDSLTLTNNEVEKVVNLMEYQQLQRYKDSLDQASIQLQIANTAEVNKRIALERELDKKKVADSLSLVKLQQQIEHSKLSAKGYPVVIAGDTLRIVYTNMGSFSAEERAQNSTERIESVVKHYIPSIDTLTMNYNEQSIEISYADKVLFTVTRADAIWGGESISAMAHDIASKTQIAIAKQKKIRSLTTILKQIGLTLLVVALCAALIRMLYVSFHKRIRRFLVKKTGVWFKGWTFRGNELLSPHQQIKFVIFLIKIVRWILILFILYIALPIIFSLFPFTQRLADTLLGWIISPLKKIFWSVVDYLPNLFVILAIWLVMRYVIKGLKYFMNGIESGKIKINGFYPDWSQATYNILRFILYAFTFVMIFNYLPYSDSKVFQGVSVFIGIIVSLGSTSAIGNIVAGMVITYMRPFKVGDHIKIGDTIGDVLEKTPFVTRIRTYKQEVVTIPNSNVLSTSVVNYSTSTTESKGVIFHVTITIGYDVPWRQIHQMMIEAANRSEYILKDPAPFVLQTSLDDFYVSYQLCAYSQYPEKQATIYSQLNQNIQDVFNENGVEIMSPHYRAARDGNCTSIPENYRPKDYTAPPFVFRNDK